MKNLLVLRTNVYSKRWHKILTSLPDNYQVLIVADNKQNDFQYSNIETISFNVDNISEAGLFITTDMQWRFGDYALYLADKIKPDYDFIWLVEPDVFINYSSVTDFFDLYEDMRHDYICTYFSSAEKEWMWTKYLNEIEETDGFRTFFPLIRISKSAVLHLYSERKLYKTKANDEIFVATKLKKGGCTIATFDEKMDVIYNRNYFSYRLPHYFNFIKSRRDTSIFHPVFDDVKGYLRHLIVKKSWKSVLKKIVGINNID